MAYYDKDPRTGFPTAINTRDLEYQRTACSDLNRERAEGILKAHAFAALTKGTGFQFSKVCEAYEAPLICLEKLGIFVDEDGFLESEKLTLAGSGAESSCYRDDDNQIVYKIFDLRGGRSPGRKYQVSRIGEIENPGIPEFDRYYIDEVPAGLRDVLVKLSLLNEIGAHPTEIVGISENSEFFIAKQSVAEISDNSSMKNITEAIKRVKSVKYGRFRTPCQVVWVEGASYFVADLNVNNIMIDRDGNPTIIDAVVGNIDQEISSRFADLRWAIEQAKDLREGRFPRIREDLFLSPDDEL